MLDKQGKNEYNENYNEEKVHLFIKISQLKKSSKVKEIIQTIIMK